MMLVKELISTIFTIREVNEYDKAALVEFENSVFYKQCFSKARGSNLFHTSKISHVSLVAVWDGKIIGFIQSADPKRLNMHNIVLDNDLNSTLIINFCVATNFRSYRIGTRMLNVMLFLLRNRNIYIAINKKEPLNNMTYLYKFYTNHNFVETVENNQYIILQWKK